MAHFRRTSLVSFALIASQGCSSHSENTASPPDAAVASAPVTAAAPARPAPVPMPTPRRSIARLVEGDEHPTLTKVASIVAKERTLTAALAKSEALAIDEAGFVTRAWQAKHAPLDHIGAVLPHRADDLLRVSPGRSERWALSLEPQRFLPAAGQLDHGRVVYPDALPSTDLVAVASDRQVEELFLLRDESAPTEFRWKLHLGADLHERKERLPDGAIDFLDENGDAAIRIRPSFAVDAAGVRRQAPTTIEGDELVVKLDAKGLAYPIVLDPVAEVPLWQLVSYGGYNIAADGMGMAYNPTASKTVLVGGSNGSSYLADSYVWTGSTWTGLGVTTNTPNLPNRVAPTVSAWGVPWNGGVVAYGGQTTSGTWLSDAYMINTGNWFGLCGPCSASIAAGTFYWYFPGAGTDPARTTAGAATSQNIPAMAGSVAANLGSQLVMFGTDRNTYTYSWNTWALFPLTDSDTHYWEPPARTNASMAGNTKTGHAVMVGGVPMVKNVANGGTIMSDAWEFMPEVTGDYSHPHWKALCGQGSSFGCPFSPRELGVMAYDSNRNKMYLTGGYDGAGDLNDLWEFDDTTTSSAPGTWTQLSSSGTPLLESAAMTYDETRRRVVLTGGYHFTYQNATYELYIRGGSCSSDSDCDTGHCFGGTCCTSVCSQCQTCSATGSEGVCTNITAGNPDPVNACPGGGQCNGSGACKPALGTACSVGTDCASGFCVNGTCCSTSSCGTGLTCADPSGTCKKNLGQACLTTTECASGNCVDGTCCSSSSCGANQHCNFTSNPGTCISDNGQACTAGTQCGSGNCVDGYCCNSSCTGQCQACDVGGSLGTCIPVTGAAHTTSGVRAACAGSGTCAAVCNGIDATVCHYPGASASCGTASCTSGVATQVGTCNGSGTCSQPTTSCGAYSCGGTICKTTCTADTDCANTTNYFCNAGTCTSPKLANGKGCTGSSACASGFCVNNTCCDSACTSTGYACNVAGAAGHCSKPNGTTCSAASECASGNCVDGVCCNSACSGQCQACDVSGNVGTCVAVTGAAHTSSGLRSACSGSGTCGSYCDGTNPTACKFPGTTTACGAASCSTGVQTNVGQCNGTGTCTQTTTPCGNYACNASACKTSCAADTDCASSNYYCNGGSCQLKLGNGSTCATAPSCQSGNCVSGVCCDTACTGAGFSCKLSGSPGKCTKAPGTACTASSECGSGFCVDGVCCDSACSGQCQACDVGGRAGTCSAVIGAPHGTRSACGGTGAGTTCGATCDGKNLTACTYPGGTTTCGSATCADGPSLSTYTQLGACDSAGSCKAGSGDCGTFKCSGATCAASCTSKTQCSAGNYCDTTKGICVPLAGLGNSCSDPSSCPSGFCVDGVCCEAACGTGFSCNASTTTKGHCRKLPGIACTTNSECGSGNCVDGVCCTSTCKGSCEACNLSGKEGTCTPIVGQPKTGHPACSATPTDPNCGLACDGTDSAACHNAPTTASCNNKPACAGGVETDVSLCDGAGSCKLTTKTCGVYACGASSCLTTCTADTDCSTGNFCKAGACVGTQALGESCTGDDQCTSGHCTDGVCCGVASCGTGAACAGPGADAGTCLKSNGTTCGAGTECASSHCVDGVCCDKTCDGQCEACAVTGSAGTCTAVTGAPQGSRAACDSLDAKDCAKASCDGVVRDKCVGFANGATTSCGADTCTADKKLQKKGACDGKGGCAKPDPVSCLEYVCDGTTNACKSACTSDADCSTDYKCDAGTGKCVQGSTCSADRTQSTDKSGTVTTCAPYMCGPDGACLKECASSDDCVQGTACDTTVHACVVTSTPDNSGSGGCAVTPRGSRTNSEIAIALSLLGLVASARKRRSKR